MADTTRIHQLTTEVLASDGEPNAQVHQLTTEVLASDGIPEAALHQVVVEVIESITGEAGAVIPPIFMII